MRALLRTVGATSWRNAAVEDVSAVLSIIIGGKAALPTAMIVECLAHAALHSHPGLEFVGLSNLKIFKGVRLGREERIELRALTEKANRAGGVFRVLTRLASESQPRCRR